jgi:hypothetical protein
MIVSYNNTDNEYKVIDSVSFDERQTLEKDLKDYIRNIPYSIHAILQEVGVLLKKILQ